MNADITIYGYVYSDGGYAVCTGCARKNKDIEKDLAAGECYALRAYETSEWANDEGLSCDECLEYIVEPYEPEEDEPEEDEPEEEDLDPFRRFFRDLGGEVFGGK